MCALFCCLCFKKVMRKWRGFRNNYKYDRKRSLHNDRATQMEVRWKLNDHLWVTIQTEDFDQTAQTKAEMTKRLQIYTLRDRQIHTENQVQTLMVRPKSCWKKLISKCSVFLFTWSDWVNLHYGWLFACDTSSSSARSFWDLYRLSVSCTALEVKITSQFSFFSHKIYMPTCSSASLACGIA